MLRNDSCRKAILCSTLVLSQLQLVSTPSGAECVIAKGYNMDFAELKGNSNNVSFFISDRRSCRI